MAAVALALASFVNAAFTLMLRNVDVSVRAPVASPLPPGTVIAVCICDTSARLTVAVSTRPAANSLLL